MKKVADRRVGKPFSYDGKTYHVKVNVLLNDLKQAIALRRIVTAFETSATKRGNGGQNVG